MKLTKFLLFTSAFGIAFGHGDHSEESPDYKYIDPENSLVDLVRQSPDTLKNFNWEFGGSTKFDEGRLIFTPRPETSDADQSLIGMAWSKNPISVSSSTGLTFETTMRSVGAVGDTGAGFSYWLIRDSDASYKNFGGPTIFDGLQILFENGVVTSYLSDATKQSKELKPFSTCYFAYQDSDVPITLRLSYSEKEPFKLTLNNYLCFETDKVKFKDANDYKIGISASSPADLAKFEQYELFKFEVYNKVTEEAKQASKGTLPSQPKVVTKVVTTGTVKPTPRAHAFAETEKKLREQLLKSSSSSSDSVTVAEIEAKINLLESSIVEVLNKMDRLFSTVESQGGFNGGGIASGSGHDNLVLQMSAHHGELKSTLAQNEDRINSLIAESTETNKLLLSFMSTMEQRIASLEEQLSKSYKMMDVVSSKIGSVSNDRHYNNIIAKLNEIDANQQSNSRNASADEALASLQSKIKWIIILLFMAVAGIGYNNTIFKQRGENKHGKIL